MIHFSQNHRDKSINELTTGYFDVLIIGGGIVGAGVALQAAAAGMRTALIEKNDFASGSSSRTTKVIHGGLRYLLKGDLEVVSDLVSERRIIQEIAPHIPVEEPMLIPLYDEEEPSFTPFRLKMAMDLYDSMAGVRGSKFENQILTKEDTLKLLPELDDENIIGSGLFLDYNNDDTRLTIENVKQAREEGATIVNHAEGIGFVYDENDQVNGAEIYDSITDQTFYINARTIINTTGPWSDAIRHLDVYDTISDKMEPTKGIHLVVDNKKLPITQPLYFDSGEHDGRMIFVIPRLKKTYFGTTDTSYSDDVDQAKINKTDTDYLLNVVNRRFKDIDLSISDIESSWVGVRPLIDSNNASDYNGGDAGRMTESNFNHLNDLFKAYNTFDISREEVEKELFKIQSNTSERDDTNTVSRGSELTVSPSGLFTLAGGKLTDYRKMAEGAVVKLRNELSATYGKNFPLINSKTYPISGGHFSADKFEKLINDYANEAVSNDLTIEEGRLLARHYGSNMDLVLSLVPAAKPYAKSYDYPLYVATSLIYSLEYESTYSMLDYFVRRTSYFYFNQDDMLEISDAVGRTIRDYLRLRPEEYENQQADFKKAVKESKLNHLR